MLLNCGVGEHLESPLDCKDIQLVHPKGDQSFIGRADAKAGTPTLWPPNAKSWLIWKDPDYWERLRAGGEGDDGGRNGWMASLTQWTWFWVDSGSWWWTGRPGLLQFMGSQRVVHNWVTELNWTDGCPTLYTKETKNHSARTVSRISSLKWTELNLLTCIHNIAAIFWFYTKKLMDLYS